jgi:NADH-quinone oxidoreductase subunit J
MLIFEIISKSNLDFEYYIVLVKLVKVLKIFMVIFAGFSIIRCKRAVSAILYLLFLITIISFGIFSLGLKFLGLLGIIIYVGAVLILFIFSILGLSINSRASRNFTKPADIFIFHFFLVKSIDFFKETDDLVFPSTGVFGTMAPAKSFEFDFDELTVFGVFFFDHSFFLLVILTLLLLVSLLGAAALSANGSFLIKKTRSV